MKFLLSALPDPAITPSLAAARDFSRALMVELTAQFQARAEQLVAFETVAMAGSLGRLEASAVSDFDCLLVTRAGAGARAIVTAQTAADEIFSAAGLRPPKAAGIFRTAISRDALLDPAALGSLDEAPAVFGKRMQFLLDARPLHGVQACRDLQQSIVAWYGSGFHDVDDHASWTYLINDLQRYLHAYAAWQQFKFERSADDSWLLRQTKLRSSRLLTFAGLMVLLGVSNAREDKQAWLLERLAASPLERLAMVMRPLDAAAYARLLDAYETIHARLNDPLSRRELIESGPDSMAAITRPQGALWCEVDAAGEVIMHELSGFILARRDDWDRRFFARLLL